MRVVRRWDFKNQKSFTWFDRISTEKIVCLGITSIFGETVSLKPKFHLKKTPQKIKKGFNWNFWMKCQKISENRQKFLYPGEFRVFFHAGPGIPHSARIYNTLFEFLWKVILITETLNTHSVHPNGILLSFNALVLF